jgi:hypothetical protein
MGAGVLLYAPWLFTFLVRKTDALEQVAWWSEPSVMDVIVLPFRLLALAPREVEPDSVLALGRALMSFALVVLAIRGIRRLGWLGRYWGSLWATPPLFMLLLMVAGIWASPFTVHRYFLVPAVAQTVLISAGALGLGRSPVTRGALPGLLVLISLAVVFTLFRIWPFPDYRAVVDQLGSGTLESCRVTVVERHMPVPDYYLSRAQIPYDGIDADAMASLSQAIAEESTGRGALRRCVLIPTYLEQRFGILPTGDAVTLLGSDYDPADRREAGDVAIYTSGSE